MVLWISFKCIDRVTRADDRILCRLRRKPLDFSRNRSGEADGGSMYRNAVAKFVTRSRKPKGALRASWTTEFGSIWSRGFFDVDVSRATKEESDAQQS